ncbi:ribbon-helix-helix domain-containing protein [Pararoseomonas baculiformis]|uniref:ribbon-helix-helix domain-containing protein n=1 Tax=Pararoseomonas baculiformis TaxID=2820812 RepID=UPI001ADF5337
MPAHNSLHVAVTRQLCGSVPRLVASGRYQNSSEVVRAALGPLEQTEIEHTASHWAKASNLHADGSNDRRAG